MSDLVLSSVNPDGTREAVVEDDGRCVVVHLRAPGDEPRAIGSVWVRNRVGAPPRLDVDEARDGRIPLQPAQHCVDAEPGPPLDLTSIEIVWLQEGDGVALFERGRPIAVVPAWTGRDRCPGYAAAAAGQGPVAWSLDDAPQVRERVIADREWWQAWRDGDPFTPVRDAALAAITRDLGPTSRYFAIDKGRWPPRAMVEIERPPGRILMTVGMGIRRQPQAELHLADAPGRRVELALALDRELGDPAAWLRILAATARLPWARATWLGAGHTVSPPGLPRPFGSMLWHPSPPPGLQVDLPDIHDEPVLVLWGTAITADERSVAQRFGRDTLAERLGDALGTNRLRRPVA